MSPSPSLAPGKSYCLENLLSGSHPDLQHSPSAHLAHTKNKLYSHDSDDYNGHLNRALNLPHPMNRTHIQICCNVSLWTPLYIEVTRLHLARRYL